MLLPDRVYGYILRDRTFGKPWLTWHYDLADPFRSLYEHGTEQAEVYWKAG